MTGIERDIDAVQALIDAEALLPAKQAWHRLKPRLTAPVAVPEGMVLVQVERLQHVIDLLAERSRLNNARSPAHNARLLLEATLAAAKENTND